ncbi:MAG: NADH-quinone oxidoreductase subunit J [Acidimicrobiia bacterium]|nr:NADH-quinone oxidoreductase subunit J [Acidimicrobiia bacterium]MBP8181466.1 NADH-quinone oxidoreductase subunit J [Acidimicrobiia bacterium]
MNLSPHDVAFAIIAAGMVVAAIGVVTTNNVMHAALFLVMVMAGSAAQYLLLAAEFVAWVQVIVYIGAVVILFLFGIMVTRAPMRATASQTNSQRWMGAITALGLFGLFSAIVVDFVERTRFVPGDAGTTQAISSELFTDFIVPFELISLLLLGALVGAIALARKD